MAYRDDRGYKIVYKTEPASYPVNNYSPPRQRPRQEFVYDNYERGYRDRAYPPDDFERGATKPGYDVGRDRNGYSNAKRGNVVVIDEPRSDFGYGEFATDDYEVIRPKRNDEGVYVLDGHAGRDYGGGNGYGQHRYDDDDYYYRNDRRRSQIPGQDRRHQSMTLVAPMEELRVVDDVRSERSYRGRSRQKSEIIVTDDQAEITDRQLVPIKASRLRTALHHDHSPDSEYNRRSRSVGFYSNEVKLHDVAERRHERPGTEAAVSGSYLVGHTGDPNHDVSIGRIHKHYSRRADEDRKRRRYGEVEVDEEEEIDVTTVREEDRSSHHRHHHHHHRRHGSEHKHRHRHKHREEDVDGSQTGPYPPQRDTRNDDDDDDRSRFSEYRTKTKKVYERR